MFEIEIFAGFAEGVHYSLWIDVSFCSIRRERESSEDGLTRSLKVFGAEASAVSGAVFVVATALSVVDSVVSCAGESDSAPSSELSSSLVGDGGAGFASLLFFFKEGSDVTGTAESWDVLRRFVGAAEAVLGDMAGGGER